MKNVFVLVICSVLFLFVSCSKETISLPQSNETLSQDLLSTASGVEEDDLNPSAIVAVSSEVYSSITIQLPVVEMNNSEVSGELFVDFSSSYDFTGVVLEDIQYIVFEDAAGNESTLTFQVNSFLGGVGFLDVAFAVGGNDLSGLQIAEMQSIIIQDEIIN